MTETPDRPGERGGHEDEPTVRHGHLPGATSRPGAGEPDPAGSPGCDTPDSTRAATDTVLIPAWSALRHGRGRGLGSRSSVADRADRANCRARPCWFERCRCERCRVDQRIPRAFGVGRPRRGAGGRVARGHPAGDQAGPVGRAADRRRRGPDGGVRHPPAEHRPGVGRRVRGRSAGWPQRGVAHPRLRAALLNGLRARRRGRFRGGAVGRLRLGTLRRLRAARRVQRGGARFDRRIPRRGRWARRVRRPAGSRAAGGGPAGGVDRRVPADGPGGPRVLTAPPTGRRARRVPPVRVAGHGPRADARVRAAAATGARVRATPRIRAPGLRAAGPRTARATDRRPATDPRASRTARLRPAGPARLRRAVLRAWLRAARLPHRPSPGDHPAAPAELRRLLRRRVHLHPGQSGGHAGACAGRRRRPQLVQFGGRPCWA